MAHGTFKTHDGVEVSLSNDVWYCYKTGINLVTNNKDIPTMSYINELSNDHNTFHYFSTEQACQQYIDKMNQPVIFITEDGVDMREGEIFWIYDSDEGKLDGKAVVRSVPPINVNCLYFSSESKAQEYLDNINKPVESTEVIGTDYTGKPIYKGHEIYVCWNLSNQPNLTSQVSPIIATVESIVDTVNYCYFVHQTDCFDYVRNTKFARKYAILNKSSVVESPELDGPIIIDLSKSELEIAYDTLVALCAKYRQDNTTPQIDTLSHYPNGVTRYSILLVNGYGDLVFETNKMQFLDEAVVIVHAWLIQNHQFID